MQIKISYKKAIEKLKENNLSDGFFFVEAMKNYVLWGKSYIFTTNNDEFVVTPFFNKNNPNVKKAQKIAKKDISSFSTSKWRRIFVINLKDGKSFKYTTTDVEIAQRVEILNKWLKVQ